MILDIIIFIAVLVVLVIVHELGHFISAKKTGMYVEEFGFGFPPKIKGWKKGETTWSINAIPLGGFVKIAGEDGENGEEKKIDSGVQEIISEEKEIEITTSGDVFERDTIVEEKFFPKAGSNNDTDVIPKDRYFSSKPIWQRILVLISGVAMNFIFGWLLISIVFSVGAQKAVVIADVAPNSPAQTVGLMPGDLVLGYNDVNKFISFIDQNKGKQISFQIDRGGDKKEIQITPRTQYPSNEGPMGVGLGLGGVDRMPIPQAIWEALKTSAMIFTFIYEMLFRLIASIFTGGNLFSYVSGPVGIYKATSQAVGLGVIYLLNLAALISINLAAINIFPFPALDGGRVVFLIIEKIIRRPVSIKVQQIINSVGFGLLLLLMAIVTVKDVIKFF